MTITQNIAVKGQHNKPIVTDLFFKQNSDKKPIVIFCHGYKGFKDWGAWSIMAEAFANADLFFVKFNFSHNGGTLEQPIDFPDLKAFGNNTYTKELDDLESVLNWLTAEDFEHASQIDTTDITLVGHSRGGGIVLIKADEDSRVTKVITLASVSDYKARLPRGKDFEAWKKDGVTHVVNGRTKQKMPHNFLFFEDFKANEERLNIQKVAKRLEKPHLILHGTNDTSVKNYNAENLKNWNENATLRWIANADHVFNTKHPWEEDNLSKELQIVVKKSVEFIVS
jgi:pimeloyl-ACP methyl ester carboxylesterase